MKLSIIIITMQVRVILEFTNKLTIFLLLHYHAHLLIHSDPVQI